MSISTGLFLPTLVDFISVYSGGIGLLVMRVSSPVLWRAVGNRWLLNSFECCVQHQCVSKQHFRRPVRLRSHVWMRGWSAAFVLGTFETEAVWWQWWPRLLIVGIPCRRQICLEDSSGAFTRVFRCFGNFTLRTIWNKSSTIETARGVVYSPIAS